MTNWNAISRKTKRFCMPEIPPAAKYTRSLKTKKYDWSVFTTSAVAEKMSWFSVALLKQ